MVSQLSFVAWLGLGVYFSTLVSQLVEHSEINELLEEIAENLIVEHLFYTVSIATNNRTPGIFFNCVNSQMRLTIRDTRVAWQMTAFSARAVELTH